MRYDLMHLARPMIAIEIATKELCTQPFPIPEARKGVDLALMTRKRRKENFISASKKLTKSPKKQKTADTRPEG